MSVGANFRVSMDASLPAVSRCKRADVKRDVWRRTGASPVSPQIYNFWSVAATRLVRATAMPPAYRYTDTRDIPHPSGESVELRCGWGIEAHGAAYQHTQHRVSSSGCTHYTPCSSRRALRERRAWRCRDRRGATQSQERIGHMAHITDANTVWGGWGVRCATGRLNTCDAMTMMSSSSVKRVGASPCARLPRHVRQPPRATAARGARSQSVAQRDSGEARTNVVTTGLAGLWRAAATTGAVLTLLGGSVAGGLVMTPPAHAEALNPVFAEKVAAQAALDVKKLQTEREVRERTFAGSGHSLPHSEKRQ